MFSGKFDEAIPRPAKEALTDTLKKKGLNQEGINNLFQTIDDARNKFTSLIDMSSNAPKDVAQLKYILVERVKE